MTTLIQTVPAAIRWFLIWSALGVIFAVQLYWYYEMPWRLSIYWGLIDWYLWGVLSLLIGKGVRHAMSRNLPAIAATFAVLLGAPLMSGVHVALTMLVAGPGGLPEGYAWSTYFQALFAKKLMLNLLTYSAIVAVYVYLARRKSDRPATFLATLGNAKRLVSATDIIRGEVSGNYVNLHTADGVWPVRITMTDILRRLPDDKFVRTSRSAMINLDRVCGQQSRNGSLQLVLDDGERVSVSRRHRARLQKRIRDFFGVHSQEAIR